MKRPKSLLKVLGLAIILGLAIGALNMILTGSSVKSSAVALVYSMSIALGIMALDFWVNPTLFQKPYGRFSMLAGYLITGVAIYLIMTKMLSIIDPELSLTLNPKRLLISLGIALSLGLYSFKLNWLSDRSGENKNGLRHKDFLSVRLHNKIKIIDFKEIAYLEAKDKYVNVHSNGEVYLSSKTLSELIIQLPDHFIQIHRGAIVNRNFVREVQKLQRGLYAFFMPNGAQLKSGHTYKQKLKALLES